jgi:hypothetical protein
MYRKSQFVFADRSRKDEHEGDQMRYFVATVMLVLAIALNAVPSAANSSKELLSCDPVFGIGYLPSEVKFEPAP